MMNGHAEGGEVMATGGSAEERLARLEEDYAALHGKVSAIFRTMELLSKGINEATASQHPAERRRHLSPVPSAG
jgi:hypothetical protein